MLWNLILNGLKPVPIEFLYTFSVKSLYITFKRPIYSIEMGFSPFNKRKPIIQALAQFKIFIKTKHLFHLFWMSIPVFLPLYRFLYLIKLWKTL
ncbi:hypothetical protein J2T03_003366 [Chryseobacterium lathyri]|jgi:hypothetical protein|nr:hypothetical protein [Chryseobacterium lathyri]